VSGSDATIAVAGPEDFAELLPLVRAYCDFYEADPADDALLGLFAALTEDPDHDGLQLLARAPDGEPVAFATLYWTFSTTRASRIGVLEDLFVTPAARGGGVAAELIEACAGRCRARGMGLLTWQTAPDNHRAQRLYDRIGATRSQWVDYALRLG
jgi:GNAT superfamily N-acetyltransferase